MKKILLAIMILPLLFTSCEECDCGVNEQPLLIIHRLRKRLKL